MKKKKRYYRKKSVKKDPVLISVIVIILLLLAFGPETSQFKDLAIFILLILAFIIGLVVLFFVFRSANKSFKKEFNKVKNRKEKEKYFENISTIDHLRKMDPFEFEYYVANIFKKMGYKTEVTQGASDNGIDIILKKAGKISAVQVKRYSENNNIGEPVIRDFFGSFSSRNIPNGFFVTTSFFTKAAKEWSKNQPIELIDANGLIDMLNKTKSSIDID